MVEEKGVAQRALFVIDPKGIIRAMSIHDANVGRSVDEAQRVLDALAFTDEFGEGCPADWKKGDKGIDMGTSTTAKTAGEGAEVPLKKAWSEWARPRLQRGWSATSQRSISSLVNAGGAAAGGFESVRNSMLSSGRNSPLVSPTSAARDGMSTQMDEVVLAQRMENLSAALQNQSVKVAMKAD